MNQNHNAYNVYSQNTGGEKKNSPQSFYQIELLTFLKREHLCICLQNIVIYSDTKHKLNIFLSRVES